MLDENIVTNNVEENNSSVNESTVVEKPLTHQRLYSTGTLIRKLREEQGISLSEFARRCGMLRQSIYKAERDILKNINYDLIKIYADVLNVNPAYLVGWSDVKERLPEMGIIEGRDKNTDEVIKKHINESTNPYNVDTRKPSTFTTINLGE